MVGFDESEKFSGWMKKTLTPSLSAARCGVRLLQLPHDAHTWMRTRELSYNNRFRAILEPIRPVRQWRTSALNIFNNLSPARVSRRIN